MLESDKLFYIMDYSGNYYRINDRDDLVIAKDEDQASVFSFVEANKRINFARKRKFYFMTPVEENHEEYQSYKEEMEDVSGNLANTIISIADKVKVTVKPENSVEQENLMDKVLEYDISQIDWKEYLTHFTYVLEALSGYRESLIKAESDVDLKICDILHYIELCDTSDDEAAQLVDLLKECREHRRDVKDEMICVDAFQKTVGTSGNLAKAKEALKSIKSLENRRYTPRKLSELFENRVMKVSKIREKPHMEANPSKEVLWENDIEEKEIEDMDWVRRDTSFDGKANDWMSFAMQQVEFYKNANQYIVNIKLDIEEIDEEISNLMEEIDSSNCNVAQGYKLFKRLKELRIGRKEKGKELQCLYILTERFDMEAMAYECESNAYELERLLYPEVVMDEGEEFDSSEINGDVGVISKAV